MFIHFNKSTKEFCNCTYYTFYKFISPKHEAKYEINSIILFFHLNFPMQKGRISPSSSLYLSFYLLIFTSFLYAIPLKKKGILLTDAAVMLP